ncbi:diacylglycerol kinase (ATP) [Deinococcus metalli]|jgi:diacylglycerol kinase (ATP)|uniref:Diacylglycerol kinase n=1 Tax=Deinococcus metalli TaxID=1141878 RepID=A0A7W8KBN1_9DEIO|nr:diacylglycerol kinase family protein [Deinococcus metalli]MBB5375222.1 diacylglycerol kinase (ATP) [Deinococcus metalli]GHF30858.1 diacylglycerol kinase [Deinococcus metalli]
MRSDGSALSLRRFWRSAGFAWAGVRHVYATQANFRVEVWCAVLALATAAWLGVALAPIVLCCALVLSLELVNTAVEAIVDLVSPKWHALAKIAKDAMAAAVLVASAGSLGVAAAVLLPALWHRLLP